MERDRKFSEDRADQRTPKELEMDYFNDQLNDRTKILKPEEGELLRFGDSSVLLRLTSKDTNGRFGIYEINLKAGTVGAKLHYHRFMSETFIVTEGTVTIRNGHKEYEAHPGTIVYVPPFSPHGFRNNQDTNARVTLIFNPAESREGFFRGLHQVLNAEQIDSELFLKLYNKYDSYPVDETNMIPAH